MGGLAPGTGRPLLRPTATRNGRPRAPRTRARSAPALRPPLRVGRPERPCPSAAGGRPAPVPVAPLTLHLDFPTTGGNSPASAGGRRNWKTPAAPLPPADPALIQLKGEIVSPKPNSRPESPRPGATDRIIRFWHPSRLPRSNRVPGSQAPVAQ